MIGFAKGKKCKGGKRKKLIDILNFPIFFFDTEDGGVGGESEVAVVNKAPADDLDGIPAAALEGDPELRDIIDEEKKASKGAKDKVSDDDQAPVDDTGAEVPGDDADKDKGADETNADEKNTSEESIDDLEFADNVIEGLKGEDLKKLPKEALEALAAYVEKHTSASSEATKASESLSKLLADPVVKRRQELLNSGKADYEVRGINETEKQTIIQKLKEKSGLDDDEALEVFNVLKDGIDVVAKSAAKDALQNLILEDDFHRRQEEVIKKGRGAFLNLGKFNKELQFKETDPNKFWKSDGNGGFVLDEKHPESKRFVEKIYPVMQALGKAKIGYEQMSNMSENAVYAIVADHLKLPVAFNTGDRDKKIAYDVRKNLAILLKNTRSGELAVNGGSKVAETRGKSTIKHGFDIERLAEGGDYYEKSLVAKPGDPKHMQLIEDLAEEGEALIAKKQKPKK
jgi:predicted transcriptional regulator/stalled ribosome alternative rescue factor ArfA